MTKTPKVIRHDQLAIVAVKMMEEHGIISMPVVDEQDTLVGILHLHDMMRAGIL
jgi:arabinose-5-phosphate isomerase